MAKRPESISDYEENSASDVAEFNILLKRGAPYQSSPPATQPPAPTPPPVDRSVLVTGPSPEAIDHVVAAPPFDRSRALLQLRLLITAFTEADEYNAKRHHNQPPPVLWVNDTNYLSDLRSLLSELKRLNNQLEALTQITSTPPAPAAKNIGMISIAGKKFVESYVDVLGKGAGALTIGGIGWLLYSLGVDKSIVDAILALAKGGK